MHLCLEVKMGRKPATKNNFRRADAKTCRSCRHLSEDKPTAVEVAYFLYNCAPYGFIVAGTSDSSAAKFICDEWEEKSIADVAEEAGEEG
jgi:hypothetical protein